MSLPRYVLHEVRALLAVHCMKLCMAARPFEGGDRLKDETYKRFHGLENHQSVQSVLHDFMTGNDVYAYAFDFVEFNSVEMEVDRADDESYQRQLRPRHMLVLKEILHRDPSRKICQHDFTLEVIANNNHTGDKLTRDILYKMAVKASENCEHALKHYNLYADVHKNDPSGLVLADMLEHVLRKMYVEFKGCSEKPSSKERKNKHIYEEEDMPETCVFQGFFAFAMFGPLPMTGKKWIFSVDKEEFFQRYPALRPAA